MDDDFTGTRTIEGGPSIDLHALSSHLAQRVDGFSRIETIRQFKGGQSNPTYQLVTPDKTYVLRTKPGPVARLLPSAHAIEREFKVMAALAQTDVPVPRVHLLCTDESVIGRAFYLMDFVEGRVLWEQSLPGLAPPERAAHYDEMNRVISALHGVNIHAVGLADYGRAGNYFERQIARWSKQYAASITQPIAEMDRLIDWLPQHLPASARDGAGDDTVLVHGDFRLDNLIFHPTEPRALAVLDWELSTLGHPLADFSYHCLAWHLPPDMMRGIAGLHVSSLGIPAEADYVRRYCERTGRDDADTVMCDWHFYLAYNLFRLASIAQGIAKRADEGTASSAQAVATGALAPKLARLGWHHAQVHAQGCVQAAR